MRFNSLVFPSFLLCALMGFWCLPRKFRKWWLLIASYFFYASWQWPYLFLLIGCGAFVHFGGKWIVAGGDRRRVRAGLVITVFVAILAVFKYMDWLFGNVDYLGQVLGWSDVLHAPHWILPLGISFYIFEAISYTVDLARKREKVHAFWDTQLYLAFFPRLIAGPILRAKEFLPQVESARFPIDGDSIAEAMLLIGSGLFMKVVLADGLAPSVDQAFLRDPSTLGSADVWLVAVTFGLEIYFDFAGYSRIALGVAQLFGLQLVKNFDFPYSASSPVEFWNRWHMSLSRWIRDYLFFPLLGRKTSLAAMCWVAVLSMTLCGLWHGAGWGFVLWGFYHGLLLSGYHVLKHSMRRHVTAADSQAITVWEKATGLFGRALAILTTFGLVSLGWLFFRSSSVGHGFELLTRAVQPWRFRFRALSGSFYVQGIVLLLAVWMAPKAASWAKNLPVLASASESPIGAWGAAAFRGAAIGTMLTLVIVYLRGQTAFIYFQF